MKRQRIAGACYAVIAIGGALIRTVEDSDDASVCSYSCDILVDTSASEDPGNDWRDLYTRTEKGDSVLYRNVLGEAENLSREGGLVRHLELIAGRIVDEALDRTYHSEEGTVGAANRLAAIPSRLFLTQIAAPESQNQGDWNKFMLPDIEPRLL